VGGGEGIEVAVNNPVVTNEVVGSALAVPLPIEAAGATVEVEAGRFNPSVTELIRSPIS
jgi:hypothetical protein